VRKQLRLTRKTSYIISEATSATQRVTRKHNRCRLDLWRAIALNRYSAKHPRSVQACICLHSSPVELLLTYRLLLSNRIVAVYLSKRRETCTSSLSTYPSKATHAHTHSRANNREANAETREAPSYEGTA